MYPKATSVEKGIIKMHAHRHQPPECNSAANFCSVNQFSGNLKQHFYDGYNAGCRANWSYSSVKDLSDPEFKAYSLGYQAGFNEFLSDDD